MRSLISSDLYKIRKGKYAFVCTILYTLLAVAFAALVYAGSKIMEAEEEMVGIGYQFIRESITGGTVIGNASLFLAIIVSIFVGSEFGFGTIKNSATKAYSRVQIYVSKLAVSLIIATIISLIVTGIGVIAATVAFGFGTPPDGYMVDAIWNVLLQLYLTLALTSLFVMMAMLIRQSGGSIAANICILTFLGTIAMLGSYLLEWLFKIEVMFTEYMPSMIITELGMVEVLDKSIVTRSLVVGTACLAITTAIGLFTFQKRDVK